MHSMFAPLIGPMSQEEGEMRERLLQESGKSLVKWQDAVFSYDAFFEYNRLWAKQRWLGIHAEQNPSDAWVIQEILFDCRPDLIVETGTHNGGGALFYASLLKIMETFYPWEESEQAQAVKEGREGAGLGYEGGKRPEPKILTVDINPIDHIGHSAIEGGCFSQQCRNVTSHKLFREMVVPIQGSSSDKSVQNVIRSYIKNNGYRRVMVILDSAHNEPHVTQELDSYWDLTSVGQYLIVQDTHLDRLRRTSETVAKLGYWEGAWAAVQKFLDTHPASRHFQVDKRREYLLYSQHYDGYLLRVQ